MKENAKENKTVKVSSILKFLGISVLVAGTGVIFYRYGKRIAMNEFIKLIEMDPMNHPIAKKLRELGIFILRTK